MWASLMKKEKKLKSIFNKRAYNTFLTFHVLIYLIELFEVCNIKWSLNFYYVNGVYLLISWKSGLYKESYLKDNPVTL